MTEQKTFCIAGDEQLPGSAAEGTKVINLSTGAEYIRIGGRWKPYGVNGLTFRENADGTRTLLADNIEVSGSFTAEEFYYQNLNGVNGALFVAPSGRVRNFARIVDHLPPSALMRDVEFITDRSAVLTGIVEPEGEPGVAYYFEWGEALPEAYTAAGSMQYGKTTSAIRIDSKTPIAVKATIGSLTPKSQYEARMIVLSNNGSYKTNAVKFTTLQRIADAATQIDVITSDATVITTSSALLHGSVTTHGATLTYFFKIWTTAGAYQLKTDTASVPAGSTVSVAASIAGLKSGTGYYCSLCVTDPSGTVHEGGAVQFSTNAVALEPWMPMAGKVNMVTIADESATVQALVVPSGVYISYEFEYWRSPETIFRTGRQTSHASAGFLANATITNGLHPERDYFIELAIYFNDADGNEIKITGGTTQFTTTD